MKEETISLLKKYKQEKLINYFSLLNKKEKEELEKQIERINFEQLNNLYQSIKQKPIIEEKRIEAISYVDKAKLSKEEQQELEKKGIEIIQTGKYAVVTMAGGQGTRLGHKGPKGTYLLNTVNGPKYIFEIICNSFMLSCGTLNENSFLGLASIMYLIASFVVSVISIAPLSNFPHVLHFSPLSLKLK